MPSNTPRPETAAREALVEQLKQVAADLGAGFHVEVINRAIAVLSVPPVSSPAMTALAALLEGARVRTLGGAVLCVYCSADLASGVSHAAGCPMPIAEAAADAALSASPATGEAGGFSHDDWTLIHDALAEVEGRALSDAEMWCGRSREDRYRREATEAQQLRERVSALLDAAPPRTGEAPTCRTCGRRKKPLGRDSMDNGLCDVDCHGYMQEPRPDHLWPGEAPT